MGYLSWNSLSKDFTDDKSTLVQVMAWCRQAPSHYLSQCCPRSLSPYRITRPQWVNQCWLGLVPSGNKPLLESHATTWHHQAKMLYGNITLTRFMIVPHCQIGLETPTPDFHAVLGIPTGPSVQGRQLWRKNGNFLLIFLQFHVYDLRFKAWGPTTFLTEIQTVLPWVICSHPIPKNLGENDSTKPQKTQQSWTVSIFLSTYNNYLFSADHTEASV